VNRPIHAPGPGFYQEMVRENRFPTHVQTKDEVLGFLQAERSKFPDDAPIQDEISAAMGLVYERDPNGPR